MASFFVGGWFRSFKHSRGPVVRITTTKRVVVKFLKNHSTIIAAATCGTAVSLFSLARWRVRAEEVLWDHQRGLEHTYVSVKDNPHRRYSAVSVISWREKASGIAALCSIILLLVSRLPIIPTLYAAYLGWSALLIIPFSYYGKDVIISWFGGALSRVERRRKIGTRPKKIILVRHGESMANIDTTLYQSTPDNQIPLSEKGKKQALLAGKHLRMILGNESVRFYVSPYVRSRQTYEGIIEGGQWKKNEYTAREEPRLREQDWGNFQDPAQIEKVDKERRQFGSFYYRMPNGESGADVWDRVTSVWDTMYREFEDRTSQNYVLVTHGLTIRLFLMRYYQWTVEQFNELWNPRNGQLAVMELQSDAKYRLWTKEDWENIEKKHQDLEGKHQDPQDEHQAFKA